MRQILLGLLLFITFTCITLADNLDDGCLGANNYTKYSEECNSIVGFELYECRVTNLCNQCNNKDAKKIFETTEYEEVVVEEGGDVLDPFYKVQENYKSNMNSIYKCVLIDIQERGLEFLEQIISATDKTGLVKKELQTKISSEKTKLKTKKTALGCGGGSEDKSDERIIKKEVLDQTSLEFCKYSYYLLYLKEFYKINQNILGITDDELKSVDSGSAESKEFSISQITTGLTKINNEINGELNKIYKVFPLAYYAYSEYEDNYVIHLLLTLIKQDYVIAREQLAKVLGPINQVAYKIKDALKNY